MTKKPASKRGVADVKRKPVRLDKVTMRLSMPELNIQWQTPTGEVFGTEFGEDTRFTVRSYVRGYGCFVILDKKHQRWFNEVDKGNGWGPSKWFRTRAAAWRYLRTHTTDSKDYKLWEVDLALG